MAHQPHQNPIRVFADNGCWWLISASSTGQTDVTAEAIDHDGTSTPLPALSTSRLLPLDQLAMPVPGGLARHRRTRVRVTWVEGDDRHVLVGRLRNDGMRDGYAALTTVP